MVETMHLPILGIVENMSYFKCPECGHIHSIFGESHIDNIASKYHIDTISKLPVDPKISQLVDQGKAEALDNKELYNLIDKIETL